ncbi:MAG: hypothetical protein WCO16_01115 [bacterium]
MDKPYEESVGDKIVAFVALAFFISAFGFLFACWLLARILTGKI